MPTHGIVPRNGISGSLNMPSCPALCRASTPCLAWASEVADGRDKPGHDAGRNSPLVDLTENNAVRTGSGRPPPQRRAEGNGGDGNERAGRDEQKHPARHPVIKQLAED